MRTHVSAGSQRIRSPFPIIRRRFILLKASEVEREREGEKETRTEKYLFKVREIERDRGRVR